MSAIDFDLRKIDERLCRRSAIEARLDATEISWLKRAGWRVSGRGTLACP